MGSRKNETPCLWQWPNVLGIDAALIAVSWYWLQLPAEKALPGMPALVLALSVWLTYLADRLLDVRKKNYREINSLRHRFVFRHAKILWIFWSILLLFNLAIALSSLGKPQLMRGLLLLLATLIYIFTAQKLKSTQWIKEFAVGVIFTAGIVIFLEYLPKWSMLLMLVLLFTGNCLVVSETERLKETNPRQRLTRIRMLTIATLSVASILATFTAPIALSALLLIWGIYLWHHKLSLETARIVTDVSLLIPPLLVFIWHQLL